MPTPNKGESEKDYVNRCIPIRQDEHPEEKVDQSAAICHSMYRKAHGIKEGVRAGGAKKAEGRRGR